VPTQSSSTRNERFERRRARALIELCVIAALILGCYGLALRFDLFDSLDHWVNVHKTLHPDEGFLAFLLGVLLLLAYSWRRHREALAETALAIAAERELARASEEYRSLFDNHPRAVFSIDPQRRYRRLNRAAEALSGFTEQELASATFPALKTRDRDRILAAFERALAGEPQRLDAMLVRKDGQPRDVEVSMVPIVVYGEALGVYVVAGDVTEDNQMRRELSKALEQAERADEAKTLLVANVSHELRTPLTSVLAATEMLAESQLDDSQQRLVGTISRNGRALVRLVDDLLDLTRMGVGQLAMETVPFDLREVVDRTAAYVSGRATEAGVDFILEIDEPPPPPVLGDPLRLGQVLINLLNNALKFTSEGEIGVRLSWLKRDDQSLEAVFRVWDTGIGIALDDQERLFDPFVQADPSCTRRYGGVGLGLAISRELVQLMDGALNVKSDAGVGSTFTVRLPFRLAADV
jgi:PAS domain S-box-containing protein